LGDYVDRIFEQVVKVSTQLAELRGSISSYADLVKKVDDLENRVIELKAKIDAEDTKNKSNFEKVKFWLPWVISAISAIAAIVLSDNFIKIFGAP